MKLRCSFTLAVVLIGGLSVVSASSQDARMGVEPTVQLAWLQDVPASPVATPAEKAGSRCTKDSDCTLHDFYCDGCNCLALRVGTKPPKCTGEIVQCLVAPCLNKQAACVDGACVVAGGASASK